MKLTNIKLSSNKKLEEAISKANECYRLRFSLSRRLENCLLKDPNLTEEHCKGNLFEGKFGQSSKFGQRPFFFYF